MGVGLSVSTAQKIPSRKFTEFTSEQRVQATTVASDRPHLAPGKATPYFGYGYQVWLPPGPRRTFALVGIYGQAIVVDPKAKLVMVQTAVRPHKDPGGREGRALWEALLGKLGGRSQRRA